MLELWANLDLETPLSRVAEEARRIEALGYDVLAVPDLIHDGIASAAIAIAATERIHVTTTALIAFPRSPMTIAVAAWDLQESSGGRFSLGLGPQVRGNIRDRFSTEWTPPAPRMRDYVNALRAIFRTWQEGVPLHFESEHYHFTRMQPYTSPPPIAHPEIPIRLAAIGPNMTAVAGELADALHTHPTNASPRFIRECALPALERGAKRTGRDPASVAIVANPLCATGTDEAAVARQWEEQRTMMATLLSTPPYWPTLRMLGREDLGPELHKLVRQGRWDALPGLLGDDLLELFVPRGRYAELADRLHDLYGDVASALTFPLPTHREDDAAIAEAMVRIRGAG